MGAQASLRGIYAIGIVDSFANLLIRELFLLPGLVR